MLPVQSAGSSPHTYLQKQQQINVLTWWCLPFCRGDEGYNKDDREHADPFQIHCSWEPSGLWLFWQGKLLEERCCLPLSSSFYMVLMFAWRDLITLFPVKLHPDVGFFCCCLIRKCCHAYFDIPEINF